MLASQDMPADTPQLSAYLLQVFEAGKGAEDHSGGIRTGLDSRALETVDVSTLHLHDTSYIYRSWGGLAEKSIINQSLRYICAILCIQHHSTRLCGSMLHTDLRPWGPV